MRFAILLGLLGLLPISAAAQDVFPQFTEVGVSYCSDWVWVDDEYEEYQRVCINARSKSGNEFSATYLRECQWGIEDCPDSPFANKRALCYITGTWSPYVKVMNRNRIELTIPAGECDESIGDPQGAQIVVIANGDHVSTTEFERLESRYREGNMQCWSRIDGGTQESRSADVVGVIDGWAINSTTYIWNYHGERWANHCSNGAE